MRQQIKKKTSARTANRGEKKSFLRMLRSETSLLWALATHALSTPQLFYSSLHLFFEGHKHQFCCLIVRCFFSHLQLLKDPRVPVCLEDISVVHSAVLQWVLGPVWFRWTGFDLDIGHLFHCIGRQNTNKAGIQTNILRQGSIQRSSAVIKIP